MSLICTLSLTFGGCEFIFEGEVGLEKTISGVVTFEDQPLENVAIRSNNKIFTYTDKNGIYTFKTKLENIEIYAEKEGYAFATRYSLISSLENADFTASKVEDLNGSLTLNKIYITPTSILDLVGNSFNYGETTPALKVAHLDIIIKEETLSLINEPMLLAKYKKQAFEIVDAPTLICNDENIQQIKVRLQANFMLQSQEALASEENWVTINLTNLTTINLNQEGKVVLYIYGNNSVYNGYTYNLCLEFNYEAN